MFIPKQQPLSDDELEGYRRVYIDFAQAIIELGLKSDGVLDQVSVMMLSSSGVISEAPETLSLTELAGYDISTPKNS